MAIYHLHGQIIQRTAGQSAVGCAAYRSGDRLRDRRLDRDFDYTRKSDVDESVILGPPGTPEWLFDRETLWNTVEAAERRSDAQTAREFDIALPIELVRADPEAAKGLMRRWAIDMFVAHRLMVDINYHGLRTGNPHAHLMVTTRPVVPFASEYEAGSTLVFDRKARHLNDRSNMAVWRKSWADQANVRMAELGIDASIDHRTLAAQEIDRDPEIHVGADASAMWKRGLQPDLKRKNILITRRNLRKARVWETIDPDADWSPLSAHEQQIEDAVMEGIPVFRDAEGEWIVLDRQPVVLREAEGHSPADIGAGRSIIEAPVGGKARGGADLKPMLTAESPTATPTLDVEAEYERDIAWYDSITRYSKWLEQDLARERAELEQARVVCVRERDVVGLGGRLERSFAAAVERAKLDLDSAARQMDRAAERAVAAAAASLHDAGQTADNSIRRIGAHATERFVKARDGLESARPGLQDHRHRLEQAGGKLRAAGSGILERRKDRLTEVADRLESARPTLADKLTVAADIRKAFHGAIVEDARTLAISTAAVLWRDLKTGADAILSFTEGVGAAAVRLFSRDDDTGRGRPPTEEKVGLSVREAATPAKAVDLVYDDIFLVRLRDRQPIPFKRKKDCWIIDESKFDDWMRARIVDHADHPLVHAEVATAVGKRTVELLGLLGSCEVPFLERRGGQVVILNDMLAKIAPGLAPHARELIEHVPIVVGYVWPALERWSAPRNSEPTSTASESGQSSLDADRAQVRQKAQERSASSPDADDERYSQQAHHMSKSRPGRSGR